MISYQSPRTLRPRRRVWIWCIFEFRTLFQMCFMAFLHSEMCVEQWYRNELFYNTLLFSHLCTCLKILFLFRNLNVMRSTRCSIVEKLKSFDYLIWFLIYRSLLGQIDGEYRGYSIDGHCCEWKWHGQSTDTDREWCQSIHCLSKTGSLAHSKGGGGYFTIGNWC